MFPKDGEMGTILLKCIDAVQDYHRSFVYSTGDVKYDVLREMYNTVKVLSRGIKSQQDAEKFFHVTYMMYKLVECCPNESILSWEPFDVKKTITLKEEADAEAILDYLVYRTRLFLYMKKGRLGEVPFEQLDFASLCKDAAFYVYDLAESLGIKAKVEILEPGYLINSYLCNGSCKHACTVVYIDSLPYLIDCTYSQFFFQKRCLLDALGLVSMPSPMPGTFMVMNESRRKVAGTLLERGWIEFSKENMKDYLDGFTIFYRNGLYYELTGDFSFTTPYTDEDYEKFLGWDDDQLAHEPEEAVGYQYRPLKDPRMKFDKR